MSYIVKPYEDDDYELENMKNGVVHILKYCKIEWMDENGNVVDGPLDDGWMDENGDVYIGDHKVDLDLLDYQLRRGTVKGSDYNPYEEAREMQREKYREKGGINAGISSR